MKLLSFSLLFSIEAVFLSGEIAYSSLAFSLSAVTAAAVSLLKKAPLVRESRNIQKHFPCGRQGGMNTFIVISLLTPMLHTVEPQNRRGWKVRFFISWISRSVHSTAFLSGAFRINSLKNFSSLAIIAYRMRGKKKQRQRRKEIFYLWHAKLSEGKKLSDKAQKVPKRSGEEKFHFI